MKIDVDLNKLNEYEFITFLLEDINDYLFTLSNKFKREQDVKKWSAALDIIRANMDFYNLYSDFDLTKAPIPHYISFPHKCGI